MGRLLTAMRHISAHYPQTYTHVVLELIDEKCMKTRGSVSTSCAGMHSKTIGDSYRRAHSPRKLGHIHEDDLDPFASQCRGGITASGTTTDDQNLGSLHGSPCATGYVKIEMQSIRPEHRAGRVRFVKPSRDG